MTRPRVIRVTRMDGAKPAADMRARLRRVKGMLRADEDQPRQSARRWANVLLLLAFLAVVYCTLFPFNFTVPRGQSLRQAAAKWDWRLYDPSDPEDWLNNILLFMPFGFALACFLRARDLPAPRMVLIATTAGAVFSSCIETLQLWLPTRDSALADILANTTGTLFGSLIFVHAGVKLLEWLAASLHLLRRWMTLGWTVAAVTVLTAWALIGPYHLRHHGHAMSIWSLDYPLALGSEPGGVNKAWNGTVFSIELASASLSPAAVDRAFAGTSLRDLLPAGAQYHLYIPYAEGPYSDRGGTGPPLKWIGSDAAGGPATLNLCSGHYLVSTAPLSAFNQAVKSGTGVTVRASVKSQEIHQGEKRVIAAVCDDVSNSNFTLMQDGDNLLVHVRTYLSGSRPSWIIPDLFAEPGPHDILVTYQEPTLRVYVDSTRRNYAVANPIDFFDIYRYVARFDHIPISGLGLEIYRVLYYLILFAPMGILLGVMLADPRVPFHIRTVAAGTGIVLPCLAMQGALLFLDKRSVRADNLALNLLLPLAFMALMSWWLRRRDRMATGQLAANVSGPPGR